MSEYRVLFVCLGNICRSPTAEGVFRERAARAGLAQHIYFDSAGTGGWHAGEAPDRRAQRAAAGRGYDLSSLRARQVTTNDFHEFDQLLAMDRNNLAELRVIAPPEKKQRASLVLDVLPNAGSKEVPDPYYGGEQGFAQVLDLLENAADAWIAAWQARFR